jgi:hypothetical protein
MIEIRALPRRGRVVVTYRGQVLAKETEEAEHELRALLPRMGPAFDLISDVSAADPLDPEAEAGVQRLAKLLVPAGLRTPVRVVGRSAGTALQFERISRAAGYEARLAFSISEAEQLLDAVE